MRTRRRRPHLRRQVAVTFQPGGGVQFDPGIQENASTNGSSIRQQSSNTASGDAISSMERAQPVHHAMPAVNSQPSSSVVSDVLALSSASFYQTSLASVRHVTATSSIPSSSVLPKPSSSTTYHSSSLSPSSYTPVSASASNASQSSAIASPAPHIAAISRSVELYGGIAFITVVALACVVSFVAWFLRSRHRGSTCCCGSRDEEEIGNQELGLGLGLYLDKHENGLDSQKVPSTPFPEPSQSSWHANPPITPTFRGFVTPPSRNPTVTPRPPAAHFLTSDSVQAPRRLLGPLQIKNYVSGDLSSSCDEAILTPKHGNEPNTPRQPYSGGTPYPSVSDRQGLSTPWAPLNVRSPPAPKQVNIAHSLSKKSEVAEAVGKEEMRVLPMPPFEFTPPRNDCAGASPDGGGGRLRSSLSIASLGNGGSAPRSEKDNSTVIPASSSRLGRWRNTLSSRRSAGVGMGISESHSGSVLGAFASPEKSDSNQNPDHSGRGIATPKAIGLGLKLEEPSSSGSEGATPMPTASPPTSCERRMSKSQSNRRPRRTKSRMSSRASSVYSSLSIGTRRSIKRTPKNSLRRGVSPQLSPSERTRPEFLRQPTAESATSFSSEASEASKAQTGEELRARRTMMLRARRRRGTGESNGSGRRLTNKVTQTQEQQLPVRYNQEPERSETAQCG